MSFCHLQLKKIHEDSKKVLYAAISCDFNETFTDEKMAEVIIYKKNNDFEFIPGEKWLMQKTLPPKFYSLPENTQSKLLQSKYKGYGNGAWTMRINIWVTKILEKGVYPKQLPE